jgi:ubiquinone/menaquinone biosynthesis C-methylase UbiE
MLAEIAEKSGRHGLSMLEVAAGSGETAEAIRRALAGDGIELNVTLLDRARTHLNGTRLPAVVGDAVALPFQQKSFDVVSSGLFVHHLNPDKIVQFLREALRVCRVAVVVNDLIRDPIHLAVAYAGSPLYRSRITRHDAPASVRQAYTIEEMMEFMRAAGAARVDVRREWFYRMGVIGWK